MDLRDSSAEKYLRGHYRWSTDERLAEALGFETGDVHTHLRQLGVERSRDDRDWIKNHPNARLPKYTGEARWPDWALTTAAGLLALMVYWMTLPPTVVGEDSGELITAAYTLGTAHPPGYPLWTMLGHLFTYFPLNSVAWRVSLMSTFWGVLTVCLIAATIRRVTGNRFAALCGALAAAFSAEFWEQSVIPEVYSLNAFLTLLCLWCLLRWYELRANRFLVGLSIAYGLSLTNHNTTLLYGPLFVGFILIVERQPSRQWKVYAGCTALALAMLSIYVYLPIRSAADPPVDWGNPETWENFKDVVTRKQYQFGFTANPRTWSGFLGQFWAFCTLYAREFTPWLAPLPILGAWALWRRSRHAFALIASVFLITSIGFILVTNMELDKQSLWVNNTFWVPAYLMAGALMGFAIDGAWRLGGGRIWVRALVPVLGVACIVLPLLSNYYRNDKSDYRWAEDYGRNIFATLEPNAIYFPTADHATFPVMYLQAVEGLRPDVTIANKYGYPEECVYQDMPADQRKGFRKIPSDDEERQIEDWVISNTDRPVYFTVSRSFQQLADVRMVNAGLIYRALRASETQYETNYWDYYKWHSLEPRDVRGEFTAELVLADYQFARGRDWLAAGDKEKAKEAVRESLRIAGETVESLNNAGTLFAEHGMLDEATEYYARGLKLDDSYDLGLRNLAKIYMQKEQWEQALALFERLLKMARADQEAILLSAQCLAKVGRAQQALERLQFLATVYPRDARAFKEMGFVYLNDLDDAQSAQRMFARSLTLDPGQSDLAAIVNSLGRNETESGISLNEYLPQLPEIPAAAPELPSLPTPPIPE